MTGKGCGAGAFGGEGQYLPVASEPPTPEQLIEMALCPLDGRRFYRQKYPESGRKVELCRGCLAQEEARRGEHVEDFAAMKHKQYAQRRAS